MFASVRSPDGWTPPAGPGLQPAPLPFAGIITARPYPPTGLTTARWVAEVPVVDVPLAELWLTQEHVVIAALWGHTDRISDAYPHVVRWRGVLFAEDGHNRIVRAALTSRVTSMPMRVFEPGPRGA